MSIKTTLLQSSLLRHLVITSTKERNMEIAEVIFLTLLWFIFLHKAKYNLSSFFYRHKLVSKGKCLYFCISNKYEI